MSEYIDLDTPLELYVEHGGFYRQQTATLRDLLDTNNIPYKAADVRPVVLCGVCELHGHCYTEDVFAFARLAEENRFCAVGKVKTNGEKREES